MGNNHFGKKISFECASLCSKSGVMLAFLLEKRANKERTGKWDIRELEIISQRGKLGTIGSRVKK